MNRGGQDVEVPETGMGLQVMKGECLMEKRKSLEEILQAARLGYAFSMESVGNVVQRFLHSPLIALFDPDEYRDSIANLTDEASDSMAIYDHAKRDYAAYIDHFGEQTLRQPLIRSRMVFELGVRGFIDNGASLRSRGRLPEDDRKTGEGEQERTYASRAIWTKEMACDGLTVEDCLSYREYRHKAVLPFLRLSIPDYMKYMGEALQDTIGVNEVYDYWFRADVELWEMLYGTLPTIADVLCRSTEALVCMADLQDELDLIGGSWLHDTDRHDALEIPFQRRNLNGKYWPPEDDEALLATKRVWLLMVRYPYELNQIMRESGK